MRRILLATALALPLVAGLAPSASAYCDPKYYPVCTNDCWTDPQPIDPHDPLASLIRACPA